MPSHIQPFRHFSMPACLPEPAPASVDTPVEEASDAVTMFLSEENGESGARSQDDVIMVECWNEPAEMASADAAVQHPPGTSPNIRLPPGGFPDFYAPFHYPIKEIADVPGAWPPPRDIFQAYVFMVPLAARLHLWVEDPSCSAEEKSARLSLGEKVLACARDGSALLDLAPFGVLSVEDLPLAELAPHLELLFLQNGNLDALPKELCYLTGLRLLDFSFNRLEALPPQFPSLENLEILWLRSNRLSTVPKNLQGSLPRLTSLDLEDNLFLARTHNIDGLLPSETVSFNGRSRERTEGTARVGHNVRNDQNAQAPPSGMRSSASTHTPTRKLELAIPLTVYFRPQGMDYRAFQRFVRARITLQQSATPCGQILGLYVDSVRRALENNQLNDNDLALLRHKLIDFGSAMAWGLESDVQSRADLDLRVLDQTALAALGRCSSTTRVTGLADLTSAELRLCNPNLLSLCKILVVLSEWHAQQAHRSHRRWK
jgi:hypothetical protein